MVTEIVTYRNLYKEHKKLKDALLPKRVKAIPSSKDLPKIEEAPPEDPKDSIEEEKGDDSPEKGI
jgi:MinD-like ATPase involved in chromosome partitioning or flagellar assembly